MLLDNKIWPIREEFKFIIDLLIDEKIVFQNPSDAAIHINNYWYNLDNWWNNETTLKPRNKAKEIACNIKSNCYQEWVSFIKNID